MEAALSEPILVSVEKPATDQEFSTPSPEIKSVDACIKNITKNEENTVAEESEDDSGPRSVSDISDDVDESGIKRQRVETNESGERVYSTTVQRREQNRLHARNTRERKKMQLDQSHGKINQLYQERARLCAMLAERTGELVSAFVPTALPSVDRLSAQQLQEIDNEMKEVERTQEKYKINASAEQLWNIRKEKNRIHARKTRLRKKMALDEAEHTVRQLLEENAKLMKKVSSLPGSTPVCPPSELGQYPSSADMSRGAPMMYSYVHHGYAPGGHMGGQSFPAMPPQMPQQMPQMGAPWSNPGMMPPSHFYDYRMGGYMGPPPSSAVEMGLEQPNQYDQRAQPPHMTGAMPWCAHYQSQSGAYMPQHPYNANSPHGRYPGQK